MLEETATAPLPPEQLKAGGKKPAGGAPLGNSNNTKHALRLLKEKVRKLGTRAIDGRSKLALMLRDLREAIMSDLGGKDQLSQAQMILVDDVARLTFWIDSIDGWLLTLPSVINSARSSRSSKSARHRSIFQTFRGVTGA
jgi:hypothetical protein